MGNRRSYRVSQTFIKKLEDINQYYKRDLNIHYSNEDIFDEMIDLYRAVVFLKTNNAVSRLVQNQFESLLEQFVIMTAKFHNSILEEIKKSKE